MPPCVKTKICPIGKVFSPEFDLCYPKDTPVLEFIARAAKEILEKCSEVASVYYDITPKPPATVEYE